MYQALPHSSVKIKMKIWYSACGLDCVHTQKHNTPSGWRRDQVGGTINSGGRSVVVEREREREKEREREREMYVSIYFFCLFVCLYPLYDVRMHL